MDRTSWKPKIYKATESVDYKAEEEGTSDGAKKGWLTRQRGGSAEEPKKDFVPIDWAGQVGATKSEADQDKASDLMDKYYELVNEPMMDLPEDGSAMEERKAIHAKGVADFKAYLESSGSATVNQDVRDILEDENYHSLNKMLTKEEPETQSSRDKEFYDESTQNTLDTLNQSKVNGFPFFSYVGQPEKIISDGKGGIILYGMKRNPNSIRRVDVKYDEGRDTYTVSFMSNRNKPKGEYNDVYFDQLGGLIAGNKGLGVESYAKENIDTVDDYFDYVDEEPDERKCEFCGAKITSLFNKKYMIDHVNSVHDAGLNPTDGQKLNKTFPSWGESYATEDDYKYDWDQLTSLAQKALSDIGYDKKSWNQEPEDIRKEMEKVAYSEENWKDVANKFYKEELNKGKKNGGEAMYGYGSATGRMSPVEAWNQGADVYGDMGYDQSLRNPIFTDFRGLKWNELPTDIQEAWKSELGYMTKGEGLVDNIEKQLNRFGVNLDRDPEQVEESKVSEADPCWKGYKQIGMKDKNGKQVPNCVPNANESYLVEWGYDLDYDFAEIDNLEDAKQKAIDKGGNVYLDNTLVYSVIPSKKIDPDNDKSSFITANHLMNVESKANEYECESCGGEYSKCPHCGHAMHDYEWEDSNDVCDSCEKGKYDESLSNESKLKANEEGVNDWWDRVTTDGGDLDMQFRGTHFNELPLHQQNHYFNLYMEELGNDKYGNHMALYDTQPDSYSSSDLWKDDPSLGNKDQYYTGWKINEPTVDSFNHLEISGFNGSTRDNDILRFSHTTESKASEAEDDWVDKYFEFTEWIEDGEFIGYLRKCKLCGMKFESLKIGEQREHLINNHGFTLNELEGNISSYEGFNQGLYGYVDAKCKTCGIEFDSIPDMDDHYAMNSDHISNLNDLDNDIPNSD